MDFTIPENSSEMYKVPLSLRSGYQATAALFGLLDLYLLISLFVFELSAKIKTARKLRLFCFLAVLAAFCHQILQQLVVIYSGLNDQACFALMNLKSTLFNIVVSFTYGYFWYRQWLLYSNPKLQHLRGKAMEFVTWLVLAFLIINPFLMFGFQFNGKLCEVQNQTCMVLKLNTVEFIPFVVVSFSYGFIQATLIFLYFYPLYKQHSTQETTGRKNVQISINVISNEQLKFEQNPNVTIANYTLSASDANNNTTRFRRPKQTLQEKLRRWLLLSLICVFTDLISATVIAVFLLSKLPGNIISVMYLWHDASMFINCLCIVCCFKAYREMLFPYVKKKC